MNPGIFDTFVSLCRCLGIQVLLFGPDYNEIQNIDYGFRGKIFRNFDYGRLADALNRHLDSGVYYLYEDDLKLHYTLIRFPRDSEAPGLSSGPGSCICSIGPLLHAPINKSALLELMEKQGIMPPLQQDFIEFYHRVPLFPSLDVWNQLVGFFLNQYGFPPKFIEINNDSLDFSPACTPDCPFPDMPDVAIKAVEERYQWENALLTAVAAGNLQQSMDAFFQLSQYKIPARISDPIRNQKNLLLSFNTLLRKAVERSHVHPLHIDNLSRQLSIQIESALMPDQLMPLPSTLVRRYCMLVNNYSRRAYSFLVQTCMDYVDFHYNADLSLSSLADLCSVSSSYLSSLFKKETNMTVTDYIHYTRIRQALFLLNASNLSVGEIASRCGFSDANYFTRTFKKLQGKTPKIYRKDMGIN
ncbi:MAG: AraC family transcriptional regulator [Lachnospiraceae bacterium]|nr:AraC family transcriptional regulator [Lachnospiraceae bacterium]